MADYRCPYGYGWCEVPYKDCPHWQGTFCELDVEAEKMDELKPCPFCGCKSIDIIRIKDSFWDTGETYHVKCANCNVETQTYFRKIDAIEAWNRRVDK